MLKQVFNGELPQEALHQEPPREVSLSWVDGFIERHSELKLAVARVMEPERVKFATKENFDKYFDNLDHLFTTHGTYHPSVIANFDETYLIWGSNGWKVVTRAGNKVGLVREPQMSEHTTLCATVFADGTPLPALVILPLVYLPEEIVLEDWPRFDWTGQKNGWISKDIFAQYCEEVLIPAFRRRRKNLDHPNKRGLLIVDGHSSRINPDLWKLFRAENIDVVILPAHTSHITQPLDLCVFSLFKRWLRPLPEYRNANTAGLKRIGLLKAADHAFQMATCSRYIEKSFKRAGIESNKLPNRDVVLGSACVLKAISPSEPTITTVKNRKNNRRNISNCIITDIIDEFEETTAKDRLTSSQPTSSKKRSNPTVEHAAPAPKRRSVTEIDETETRVTTQMDVSPMQNLALHCSQCQRDSSHGTARWTQCPICEEVFVCDRCPVGLGPHYEADHEGEPVPKRRTNARQYKFQEEDDEYDL